MTGRISVETKEKREIVDVTEKVTALLGELGVGSGVCSLFVMHTTAALTVGELEDGNGPDLLAATEAIVPKLKYLHSDDIMHSGAHIMSALIGSSVSLPVRDGKPLLGVWQRVSLVEFDGPRERVVSLTFTPDG